MKHHQLLQSKQFSRSEIVKRVMQWKLDGKKIVFTNGCFDLIHPGHVDYLNRAADLGDIFIVALNTDSSVQKLKGLHRPIQHEASRMQVMAALECVDGVFLFNEDTPLEILSLLLPDVLVKGGDYSIENIVGAERIMANGGKVEVIPFLEGHSTSAIEKRIIESKSDYRE